MSLPLIRISKYRNNNYHEMHELYVFVFMHIIE